MKRLLPLIAVILTACGGGGNTGSDPAAMKLGTYENPHEECTFRTIQDYWEAKVWCKVIYTTFDGFDNVPKAAKHINLSYVDSGEPDDCANPHATKGCRIYSWNNVMEESPETSSDEEVPEDEAESIENDD